VCKETQMSLSLSTNTRRENIPITRARPAVPIFPASAGSFASVDMAVAKLTATWLCGGGGAKRRWEQMQSGEGEVSVVGTFGSVL